MHKQFEAWLAKSQQLTSRNFEDWQRPTLKVALYMAWRAGRRHERQRIDEKQNLTDDEYKAWLNSAEFPE